MNRPVDPHNLRERLWTENHRRMRRGRRLFLIFFSIVICCILAGFAAMIYALTHPETAGEYIGRFMAGIERGMSSFSSGAERGAEQ